MDQQKFMEGDRVSVSLEYRWAQGAKGTVGMPPAVVRRIASNWQGVCREVRGVRGPIFYYWVYFDSPVIGPERDGPFVGGEIDGEYLLTESAIDHPIVSIQQENL